MIAAICRHVTRSLIELNGDDIRRDPLAVRKARLERVIAHAAPGVRFNEVR